MKQSLIILFIACMPAVSAQSVPPAIEERHAISYWWWVLGVILAIGAGIIIYMLIKKDPRRDAVD